MVSFERDKDDRCRGSCTVRRGDKWLHDEAVLLGEGTERRDDWDSCERGVLVWRSRSRSTGKIRK